MSETIQPGEPGNGEPRSGKHVKGESVTGEPENGALERARVEFGRLVTEAGAGDLTTTVVARLLSPEEAIGTPERRDYPLVVGRERVIEARVAESCGHAFTDTARDFSGRLADVLALDLDENGRRAIFLATMNATLHHLGRLGATRHCRDEDPERCGAEIARTLAEDREASRVGLIGLNPAIAEHLVATFGADRVRVTDRDPGQVGRSRFGILIRDGAFENETLIGFADIVLMTGTTLVNGTFDTIWGGIRAAGKQGLVYGVTAAGVCELLGIPRICPYAEDG